MMVWNTKQGEVLFFISHEITRMISRITNQPSETLTVSFPSFIQFKKLLICVKLLPQVNDITGSLISQYYELICCYTCMNSSLKQINSLVAPHYGCSQIVSTHTHPPLLSTGFTQTVTRILPWHLVFCHFSPRFLCRTGNTFQARLSSSREPTLVFSASLELACDTQVSAAVTWGVQ